MSKTRDERRETREKQLLKSSNSACHCEERSDAAIHNDFKMTEVGMIPWDWEVKEFKNVATLINGRAYSQFELLDRGKYRVLRVGNFGTNDSWYYSNLELPDKMYCEKGDLLYCWSCTYGAYIWNQEKTIYHYHIWKVANLKAEKKYLQYILNNDVAQQMNSSNGSTMAHITKGFLENRLFAFPTSIDEQQRIAKALSDVDSLISNLEKLIAKKKNIKQGAMQQLLTGRKRLPGFGPSCHPERSTKCAVEGSSHFKMTELGPIPSDWKLIPVSELAKDMADGPFGSNLKKEHYTSDPETRIIQLSNIGEEGWIDENIKYTTFEHAKTIARCIVPNEESILVAKMMPAGRAIICPNVERQYVLGSDVIRITANEKLYSKYFVYASKSNVYLKQISDNTQGSTRQRTSISKLRKIQILLPSSVKEQTAIANVLSDMDSEIQTLETKLAKYRKLKTGMMQQLLTGKIRLI